jgi:hypothetical protein
MRSQQRNFVVEFKSRSRHNKSKPTSIWGDTDLKAVARQVEDQSAHLFKRFEEAELKNDTLLTTYTLPHLSAAAAIECPPDLLEGNAPEVATISIAHGPVDAPVVETHQASEPTFIEASKVTARRRATRQKQAKRSVDLPSEPMDTSSSIAELADLEAQNKRLKALLREHLLASNRRLKEMLLRFS